MQVPRYVPVPRPPITLKGSSTAFAVLWNLTVYKNIIVLRTEHLIQQMSVNVSVTFRDEIMTIEFFVLG
ncbi:hypothetical protein F2P81_006950 [Scophthalmus maximus]|uniref:Uncharacterized protein n=1 Tax=Scophthalmus maximus TaxID=52904 RepID=A0A6A4TFU0_SCOMX|nr:hypothetical protein F2P81_006950 [Scophthalmus maximus]